MKLKKYVICLLLQISLISQITTGEEWWKPYSPPCTERENVFEFTEKPKVRKVAEDRYEITFAVKGYCDATVAIIDPDPKKELVPGRGVVVRHLGAGVLGPNAPSPFQKNSLKQTLYWDGKDDLGFYHKDPQNLKVRVSLGLKPVFDKRLGGTSPYNLPGYVMGVAVGSDGVYVITKAMSAGFQHAYIRKFDHHGNYLYSLLPPPAKLTESQLGGMGFVEYEPGKRAVHGPDLIQSIDHNGWYMPPLDGLGVVDCQPVVIGNKLFFANTGHAHGSPGSFLYYIYTDGSTDVKGMKGIPLAKGVFHNSPRLTVSPDAKTIYFCAGMTCTWTYTHQMNPTCIYTLDIDSNGPARVFVGEPGKPGSDNEHFGNIAGIACDAKGRIYVSDSVNNRIQIYSPEGKYLKSIGADRPGLLCVDAKTGGIYVQNYTRREGRSIPRLTKFASFEDPREVFHVEGLQGWMALDTWTERPRIWIAIASAPPSRETPYSTITIWEEQNNTLIKIKDFDTEASKETGYFGRWNGHGSLGNSKSVCDPVREKLYYGNTHIFNLVTGTHEGILKLPGSTDDIAFDKHGYMHAHFNPCFFMQGVGRFDPSRKQEKDERGTRIFVYPECPYDYGVEKSPLIGVLPVKDQPGAKGFQDGLGVNMRGDIAEQCNIYYAPKMDDEAKQYALQGSEAITASGIYNEEGLSYERFLRSIEEAKKRGEEVYFIRRTPGIALVGATIWTFKRSGELHKECAVIAGDLINGVQIDEDNSLYFVTARPRVYGNKIFLSARGGHFGIPESKHWIFTGTLVKTRADGDCRILYSNAQVPLEPLPSRPPELAAIDFPDDQRDSNFCWIEGAEWLYAGASPIVNSGCSCPSSRLHVDWYKRVYLPESYRHSIGILDTNGNLIMHLGRYANFDTAPGGKEGCQPGSDDIGVTYPRYIGGTDNYLAFEDWGERLIVLKLTYHTEETVQISTL